MGTAAVPFVGWAGAIQNGGWNMSKCSYLVSTLRAYPTVNI